MGNSKHTRALLNEDITAPRVRLINKDGEQIGIVPRTRALAEAKKDSLDLVLIAPDADPPVVKVLDYGKHTFEQKKYLSANRKKQKQTQVKEVRVRAATGESDYWIKVRKIIGFLDDGDKAKISLRFRGRESLHPENGIAMLKRIETDLSEHSVVEIHPKMEGQQMIMVLAPISRKGKNVTLQQQHA